MGGGSGGGQNTVQTSQAIPEFEQQSSLQNQALAQSIGSQPYPVYQAPLIQGFTPTEMQGQQAAINSAGAYAPWLQEAGGVTANALNSAPNQAGVVQSYMNPYIGQALAPQLAAMNIQLGQEQRGIDQTATQAGAYGDARQGAASALQNLYGNLAMENVLGQGYSNAYQQALGAAQNEQQTQLAGGQQLANLGAGAQSLGLTGADAIYGVGQQQQQLGQQELSAAYQQYLNQVNWPVQMLNIQESALSNSPYNLATSVTLPNANTVAQGFGGLTSLAGLFGSLGSGQRSGSGTNVFGA